MRVLVVAAFMLLWLYACTQPPEVLPDEDINDIYRCYLNKDGTLLICPEKIKPTKVARG